MVLWMPQPSAGTVVAHDSMPPYMMPCSEVSSVAPAVVCFCSNTLTCSSCPEEEEYYKERPDRDYYPEMGLSLVGSKCMFNKQYTTPVGLAGKPGVNFVGTFTGTCYLMESKDHSCNLPETCEYVVVSLQGVIYQVNKAVRVGPASTKLEACLPKSTDAKAAGAKVARFSHHMWPLPATVSSFLL